jgi:hypothetical protein
MFRRSSLDGIRIRAFACLKRRQISDSNGAGGLFVHQPHPIRRRLSNRNVITLNVPLEITTIIASVVAGSRRVGGYPNIPSQAARSL